MNGCDLEKIVVKTYNFVRNTVPRRENHNKTVVAIILKMYELSNIPFEEDYFSDNILDILKEIEGRRSYKIYDKEYNPEQLFIY